MRLRAIGRNWRRRGLRTRPLPMAGRVHPREEPHSQHDEDNDEDKGEQGLPSTHSSAKALMPQPPPSIIAHLLSPLVGHS